MAEHQRGAGVGAQNLIYLHGDVGVGGGIIVGGDLLDGDGGYGSEVGHMLVNPYQGRPCGCGSRGCLEAEVGERALLDEAGRPADHRGREAVRAVVAAAEQGEAAACEALRRIGDWLGIGVANLINLFNPGVVIFGGTLREVFPGTAAQQVRNRIAANVLPVSRDKAHLRVSALGYDATLIGAAELAFTSGRIGLWRGRNCKINEEGEGGEDRGQGLRRRVSQGSRASAWRRWNARTVGMPGGGG